ncbi:Uma2 family endonuclease [Baaleninema simplex]|uniref:Uma2 family endonuclease n=1 Tax=Baaleninema simplex TaxID=2862350 RepID=UPI000347DEBD|nr:Uma2 family endonuclease [Baaleninema simplex]
MATSSSVTTRHYSLAEYRELEAIAERRHEYRDGEIVEMPGGSVNHSRLVGSLYRIFEERLESTQYEPFNSDLRLWIPAVNRGTYPDLMVVDREPLLNDDRTDEILNPRLIAEVLSPSTADRDRGSKFTTYRTIPSFREYLLVSQNEPLIEHYWQTDDRRWHLEDIRGLDTAIELQHLPLSISLQQLYRRVSFP